MSEPTFDPAQAAAALEANLRSRGDEERAVQVRRYLKSELEHYGASVPAVRSAVKTFARAHPDPGREEFLDLAERLWARSVHECRVAAVELLDHFGSLLVPSDFPLLERFIRESRTWALVDRLAASVTGSLVERHPEAAATLDRWARDPDFWVRRSALLALLVPLRRGEGDFSRFTRYAGPMLEEKEFFIRKAIGWVLRETGKKRPELVHDWLLPRAKKASGLTVREAVKHLPEESRREILEVREGS